MGRDDELLRNPLNNQKSVALSKVLKFILLCFL